MAVYIGAECPCDGNLCGNTLLLCVKLIYFQIDYCYSHKLVEIIAKLTPKSTVRSLV